MDAATGHIAVEFQTALNKDKMLKATQKCEDKAEDHGVIVKAYQFDSRGAFTSQELHERPSNRHVFGRAA